VYQFNIVGDLKFRQEWAKPRRELFREGHPSGGSQLLLAKDELAHEALRLTR
jgi:hypothetical protein